MQAINEKDISFNLVLPKKSHFTFYLYTVYSSLVKIFDFTHNIMIILIIKEEKDYEIKYKKFDYI